MFGTKFTLFVCFVTILWYSQNRDCFGGKMEQVQPKKPFEANASQKHSLKPKPITPPMTLPPKQMFVGARLSGGLGNGLFMLASAIGIAHKNGAIPCYIGSNMTADFVEFDLQKCPLRSYDKKYERGYAKYKHFRVTKSSIVGTFLQSYKYFKSIPPLKINQKMKAFAQKYTVTYSNAGSTKVGIHARRGDHLRAGYLRFPSDEYFKSAMRYFMEKYGKVQFFVVSNDITWCKKQPFFKETHIVTEKHTAAQDMAILATCDHVILSIGTFGWWGGLLSGGEVFYHADEFNMHHKTNKDRVVKQDYYLPQWKAWRKR
jgi:galactoside 2-L-fucosyltransferase 1/2